MVSELKIKDIDDSPDLIALAQEILRTKQGLILRLNDEDVVVVQPAKQRRRKRRGKGFDEKDALWGIVGIAEGDGLTDVSSNKHTYLAQAYLQDHLSREE